MKGKKLGLVLLVLIIIGALAGVVIANKPKTEANLGGFKEGPRVKVETVKKGGLKTLISTSGKLEVKDTHTIYAETNNKISGIYKKTGDVVKKGDLILTLDTDTQQKTQKQLETQQLQLKAAQEALDQLVSGGSEKEILSARTSVVQSQKSGQDAKDLLDTQKTNLENYQRDLNTQKKNYDVAEQLFSEGLISQKEMDEEKNKLTDLEQKVDSTKSAIASSQKNIEAAALQEQTAEYNLGVLLNQISDPAKKQSITAKQAEIKNLQTLIFNTKNDLEKTGSQIKSPIDGIITDVPTKEGMPVPSGSGLVSIVDPSKLIIKCAISPYYAADLKTDLNVKIRYTGSEMIELDGKVTKVSPVAGIDGGAVSSTNIPVEIEVTNPGNVVRPGFVVSIDIITHDKTDVCVAPLSAVMKNGDGTAFVYVVKEDGSLEKRKVAKGIDNGVEAEISEVADGEMVVVNPAGFLKEGIKVCYSLPEGKK